MSAREKIEALTNSWYGYLLFTAVAELFVTGIGFFSMIGTAFSFVFSCFVACFLGRRLLAKSSLTRVVLVILSGICTVLGAFGTAKMGWTFFHTWSLTTLVYTGMLATSVMMHARSFRVLTDSSVKSYMA